MKQADSLFSWPEAHPAPYSPEVLAVMWPLIRPGERIHDPCAGTGRRLAKVCDGRGAIFTAGDINVYPGHDYRVLRADARDPASYPPAPFTVTCSPVYVHKRCADYPNGPTPNTKVKGRREYAFAADGWALHPDNLARTTGRPSRVEDYWSGHEEAVKHWDDRVLLNVDLPISEPWQQLLRDHGYRIQEVIPAFTRRHRGLANADKRADHEVVIVAARPQPKEEPQPASDTREGGTLCFDCRIDTAPDRGFWEWYMVHDHVWEEAQALPIACLCIGCLERRLGRPLTPLDFTDAPVNGSRLRRYLWCSRRSPRLAERLGS